VLKTVACAWGKREQEREVAHAGDNYQKEQSHSPHPFAHNLAVHPPRAAATNPHSTTIPTLATQLPWSLKKAPILSQRGSLASEHAGPTECLAATVTACALAPSALATLAPAALVPAPQPPLRVALHEKLYLRLRTK
jgi:hypothetical protein